MHKNKVNTGKKTCKNCGKKRIGRKVFCSNYCQIEYYNQQIKPIVKIDKWRREHFACSKCGHWLRTIDTKGKVKLLCSRCFHKSNHKPKPHSQFIKRTLNNKDGPREVILEITQHNRNWHYLDGKPVMGFKSALKYFRIKVYQLKKRYGYIEI